jgi:transcriptional regulator with PAS, ATPase and Fis domain
MSGKERSLYIDLVLYHLYVTYHPNLQDLLERSERGDDTLTAMFYADFAKDANSFFSVLPGQPPAWLKAEHIFACLFQVRRAFYYIFSCIIGGSMPTAKLRAATWQSIFTHNMRRYVRCIYRCMTDVNVLITGPSGTGKDLVAKAIGLARYVEFDTKTKTFAENFAQTFHTLNISALSPTLIESELFGHCKGSFTGATADRTGHLESCSARGTIFLDEIGEVPPSIQVKLLHVLQSRMFQRLGETNPRPFKGKIIAATNRNLEAEMENGNFRRDFYYRLCSDVIVTPSLREQLNDEPQELHNLIYLLVNKLIGPEECYEVTKEVVEVVENDLGSDYPWQGNVRELEQCVRNIIVRKKYCPSQRQCGDIKGIIEAGDLTADELLSYYCTAIYKKTENYQEVARRLHLDRRTVKSKVNFDLYDELAGDSQ